MPDITSAKMVLSSVLHVCVLSALRHSYSGLSCFLMIRSRTLFDGSKGFVLFSEKYKKIRTLLLSEKVRIFIVWCRWWGSNPHVLLAQGILSPPRLPFRHTGSWVWNRFIIPDLHHKIKTKVALPGKIVEIFRSGLPFCGQTVYTGSRTFPAGAPGGTAKEKP